MIDKPTFEKLCKKIGNKIIFMKTRQTAKNQGL